MSKFSGIEFRMREKIFDRLVKAGATSSEKAVTIKEAKFDLQEQLWLSYFAGAFMGKIKMTQDRRYYARS